MTPPSPHQNDVKSSGRVEAIDVLRGLAALMVTWWHLFDPAVRYFHNDLLQSQAALFAQVGGLGVYMFFVISGFIIPMAGVGGGRSVSYWTAISKRMMRLYPPFFASIIFVEALLMAATYVPGFAGHAANFSLFDIVANATYLAPFVGVFWINPVFWTLLIEVEYYFLIYAVLRHIEIIPRIWLVSGSIFFAILPLFLHSFTLIFDYTDCFAAGFLAFLIVDTRISRALGLPAIAVASIVVGIDKGMLTAALAAATAALCTVRGTAPKTLVGLGTISYSLYLTHFFVATKSFRLFHRYTPDSDVGTIIAYALSMVVCLVVAIVFYHLVERPAIGWSHRISARRRA